MRVLTIVRLALGLPLLALTTIAGTVFLWIRVPGGSGPQAISAALFAVTGLAAMLGLMSRWTRPVVVHLLAVSVLAVWFGAMRPSAERDWAPEVSRQMTAVVTPPRVLVRDVRDVAWRSEADFTPRWEERAYNLDDLRSVDLINSYWSGRWIAHTLLSFGFADGRHLAFSIEIRPERGEEFSSVAGFFNQYESVVIAADERDIIRLRTSIRREDVELYRLKAGPEQLRGVFLHLVGLANDLARTPAFYNTLRANCTTQMFDAARSVAPGLPFDWRILLSGFVPAYAYDQGLLDTRMPFETLRERGRISERGVAAGDADDFSARIRDGVPDPNRP